MLYMYGDSILILLIIMAVMISFVMGAMIGLVEQYIKKARQSTTNRRRA